jgi:hypothetical protein
MAGGDGDDAAAVLRADMAAGQPDHGGVHRDTGHLFGQVNSLGDGLGGPIDLDHRPFADAAGDRLTDPEHAQTSGIDVGNSATNLGRS